MIDRSDVARVLAEHPRLLMTAIVVTHADGTTRAYAAADLGRIRFPVVGARLRLVSRGVSPRRATLRSPWVEVTHGHSEPASRANSAGFGQQEEGAT